MCRITAPDTHPAITSTLEDLRILETSVIQSTVCFTFCQSALIVVRKSTILSLYLILMHVLHSRKPHEQKLITRALHFLMPIATLAVVTLTGVPHAEAMVSNIEAVAIMILLFIVGKVTWHFTIVITPRRRAGKEPKTPDNFGPLKKCSDHNFDRPMLNDDMPACDLKYDRVTQSLGHTEIQFGLQNKILDFTNYAVVAAWKLDPFVNRLADPEVHFGNHPQIRVDQQDIGPDAKCRPICKLIMHFQNGIQSEGSGWLIDNCTVVTSGHCVYNQKTGCAVSVEVYVGYNGVASMCEGNAECQMGEYTAVHWGWYTSFSVVNDLAFIRVAESFMRVDPITWKDCPINGKDVQIRIVGYPGGMLEGEKGQYMFESTGPITFNLEQSDFMLRYKLDTETGNSGSPVLEIGLDGKATAIGVHRGGSVGMANTAVTIGHKGNIVSAFLEALSRMASCEVNDHSKLVNSGGDIVRIDIPLST